MERGAASGEPVHVRLRGPQGAPEEFVWRGQRYQVRAVEALERSGGTHRSVPLQFRVRTATGLRCVISQDAYRGFWRIERVLPTGGRR
jgi:hypothetical protein